MSSRERYDRELTTLGLVCELPRSDTEYFTSSPKSEERSALEPAAERRQDAAFAETLLALLDQATAQNARARQQTYMQALKINILNAQMATLQNELAQAQAEATRLRAEVQALHTEAIGPANAALSKPEGSRNLLADLGVRFWQGRKEKRSTSSRVR